MDGKFHRLYSSETDVANGISKYDVQIGNMWKITALCNMDKLGYGKLLRKTAMGNCYGNLYGKSYGKSVWEIGMGHCLGNTS